MLRSSCKWSSITRMIEILKPKAIRIRSLCCTSRTVILTSSWPSHWLNTICTVNSKLTSQTSSTVTILISLAIQISLIIILIFTNQLTLLLKPTPCRIKLGSEIWKLSSYWKMFISSRNRSTKNKRILTQIQPPCAPWRISLLKRINKFKDCSRRRKRSKKRATTGSQLLTKWWPRTRKGCSELLNLKKNSGTQNKISEYGKRKIRDEKLQNLAQIMPIKI